MEEHPQLTVHKDKSLSDFKIREISTKNPGKVAATFLKNDGAILHVSNS